MERPLWILGTVLGNQGWELATTSNRPICIYPFVVEPSPPRVRSAEVFRDGVLVTFVDGRCALFSADLLHASMAQAQDLTDQGAEGDDQSGNRGGAAGGAKR